MGKLDGKVTIITGGAGGIGRQAAKTFAAEGSDVLLVDLEQAALDDAVAAIGSNRVSGVVADVTEPAQVASYVETAVARYGGVDVFLNNAGIEGRVQPISELDVAAFDAVMAVNVRGAWLGLKHVIPAMQARGGGSIVITSSVAGVRGAAGFSPYVTSKHAVIGMMRSAALECAPLNIRVNTVNPSPVETRMMRSLEEQIMPGAAETAKEMMRSRIPLGRYAEPDDIAKLMLFLASDDSAFITGSVYMADGGNTTA